MTKRIILIIFGTIALVISLMWGISKDQVFEPWTAVLSSILFLLGIFFFPPDKENANKNQPSQFNFLGFFSNNRVKKAKGSSRQSNWFTLGSTNEIDNSDTTP